MTILLTNKQKLILEFIQQNVKEKGFPPTMVEIADHFGLKSPNSSYLHCHALVKKGYLQLHRGISRGITVIKHTDTPADQVQSIWNSMHLVLQSMTANDALEAAEIFYALQNDYIKGRFLA